MVLPFEATPSPELVFQGRLCSIGALRCHADDARFARPAPIQNHVFVFPKLPVWVDRRGEVSFLADPTLVTFHAEGDEIRRRAVDERGDCCNWFALREDYLLPRVDAHRPRRLDPGLGPFGLRHGPSSRTAYLRQSVLVDHLMKGGAADVLQVEETVLGLADEVFRSAYRVEPETKGSPATRRRHERLVDDVKSWLGEHFAEAATLEDIAAAVSASPFHVHRVFRAWTGRTLHDYRHQLRLRTGLAAILEGEENLTALGLSLGFASHSHFTDAFKRCFGFPPSKLRKGAWERLGAVDGDTDGLA